MGNRVTPCQGRDWGRDPVPPGESLASPRAHPDSPGRPARLWDRLAPGCSGQGHPRHEGTQLGATARAP